MGVTKGPAGLAGLAGPASVISLLRKLAFLTQKYGFTYEAQHQQIKGYPFLVDPDLDRKQTWAELDVALRRLAYVWTSARGAEARRCRSPAYVKRLQALRRWVSELLGPDWMLTVSLDGIQIFPVVTQPTKGHGKRSSRRTGRIKRPR